jgi:hypothetical protein
MYPAVNSSNTRVTYDKTQKKKKMINGIPSSILSLACDRDCVCVCVCVCVCFHLT